MSKILKDDSGAHNLAQVVAVTPVNYRPDNTTRAVLLGEVHYGSGASIVTRTPYADVLAAWSALTDPSAASPAAPESKS
jgi:hypothetical protein